MAEEFEQVMHCQMCDAEYHVGRSHHDGHFIPRYQLHVCDTCYDCNAIGWAPLYEQKLLTYIKKLGRPLPTRNQRGLFPRD
jgi:hypothetical protein